MESEKAEKFVQEVLNELMSRRGFDHMWWDHIESDTRLNIFENLLEIARKY